MEVFIAVGQWDSFLLLLARLGGMVAVAPILGSRPVPPQVKIGLCALTAWILLPVAKQAPGAMTGLAMVLSIAKEIMVGLVLGFAASLIFSAVQVATRFMGAQIGLGMPSIMDPLWPENEGFLDTMYGLLAAVVFLNLDGHCALLAALAGTVEVIPLGGFVPAPVVGERLIALAAMAISAGVALAMPVVGAMLVADMGMALVVRTIPQANIFSVGLPTKMALGAFVLFALMPATVTGLSEMTRSIEQAVATIWR